MEFGLETGRTDDFKDELGFTDGGETERQEVEDLPNYDDGSGGESLSDDDFDMEGCNVCDPAVEEEEETKENKTTWTEQVQMIHLRRYIDQLAEKVQDKDYEVTKTREELKKSTDRIQQLELEKHDTVRQMQTAEKTINTSASYRLRSQYDRIIKELENEEELKGKIKAVIDKAEYELSQAKVEQGKYLLKEDELQKREQKLKSEKTDMAQYRNNKEQRYAQNYVKHFKKDQSAQISAYEEEVRNIKLHYERAEKSQQKHSKHLSRTVSKIKQREIEEQEREKEHMQRRMETMLCLKKDIAANRENLRSLQARDRAIARNKQADDEQLVDDILADGGNPAQYLTKRSTVEQFEKQKTQHLAKQRERQIEIAGKILLEEERIKRRKEQQPQLWDDQARESAKIVKAHRKRKLKVFEGANKDSKADEDYEIDYSKYEGKTGDESDEDDHNILTAAMSKDKTQFIPDSDSEHEDNNNMAKPEFEGMWDQHKPYEVPKDLESGPKLPGASKMEREVMNRVLDKHRENIVIKQVAAGREFKGYPFYSKPAVVHFKDFEVGKTYKKKVILTNVSYSVNYCKLLGITEHLKDFIKIDFDPPGQMSAGLTCEMLVTFKPMINEDLAGEVSFLAQTGPFQIPLQCTTKKCDLTVDMTTADFSTSVIGETLKRTITLTNNGALGTTFEFFKLTGMKQRTLTTAETSLGRLTTADTMRNVSPDSAAAAAEGGKDGKGKLGAAKKKDKDGAGAAGEEEKKDEEKPEDGVELPQDATRAEGEAAGDPEDEDIPENDGGSSMAVDHMDDLMDLDGMRVGSVVQGDIGPFSSVKLDIVWQPTIPGKVDVEFSVSFADPDSENIVVNSLANAIDVPVWVERQTVDLKICMFDRLYQDTIIVNNRATTALRLKFEVCKELRNHLELLPKTGYIQAQSQFSAQLKFLPRKSLFEDAGKFFDRETGVLEAPMIITVADQTRPVPFTVHAVVTNSDMEFDVSNIDFGCCTIYEAVKKTVKLTNHSILSQQFGFIGLPDYVDVQPNDGFGTLLPLETVELDIIFQPKKSGEFNFELTCKSLINRVFKIKCTGVGVHPPLEMSDQVIHFAATTINDVSTASFHVINSHTSMNEFSHPVPRIGKGEIPPVGPTSFEFIVPEDAPFTISPSVGTVEPGEKSRIQVRFTPRLAHDDIIKEAVRMITKAREIEAQDEFKRQQFLEQQQAEELAKGPASKGSKAQAGPAKGKLSASKKKGDKTDKDQMTVVVKGPAPIQAPDPNVIDKNSNEYNAAHASLLRQFKGKFQTCTVPCYVASGKCAKPGELPYSVVNTLFLNVHCPAIRPQLVVISDNGRSTLDFGDISIGQSVINTVTIQNISDKPIDLHSSILDPEGPFLMVNALRLLPPDASHTILIGFTPHKGAVFQEVMRILAPTSTLHITLAGKGVSPMINLSVKDGMYDMGAVIAGEYREETFKIENTSSLSIEYCIKLDSQSLLRYSKNQGLPQFVKVDQTTQSLVGSQNNNGQQVFDCVPSNGIIPKAGAVEITVTFAPDHPSDFFSDGVRIDLFGQEDQHIFRIKGVAKPHIMFLEGQEKMAPDVESLSILPIEDIEDGEASKLNTAPVLVNVRSISTESEFAQGSTDIFVGCVRTMAVSQKKNGEWQFDNLAPIQQLGFNIDPPKGMLEAGTKKPVTVTWTPPPGHDPNKTMETSINVQLRGDINETYRLILKGFVVSE